MSTEPKRGLAERIHAEADIASRAGQSDRLRVLAAEVRGYVSPEEATVREAAARREALLEARGEVQRRMDDAEFADGGKLQTWDALASVIEWIEEKA